MNLEFDEAKHEYTVDGVVYPSVTTILNYITADHYGAINPSILEMAKARGTAVHEATQLIDLDCPPEEIESGIEGYVVAYLAFLRDYDCEWEYIEHPFFNPDLEYCGTIDRAGWVDGERAVLDIKTTSSPTKENYISVCSQTVAYEMGLENIEYFKAKRYALYLKADGTYRVVDCSEYEAKHGFSGYDVFKSCLDFYKYMRGVKNGK